jgi:hypothetical protein
MHSKDESASLEQFLRMATMSYEQHMNIKIQLCYSIYEVLLLPSRPKHVIEATNLEPI